MERKPLWKVFLTVHTDAGEGVRVGRNSAAEGGRENSVHMVERLVWSDVSSGQSRPCSLGSLLVCVAQHKAGVSACFLAALSAWGHQYDSQVRRACMDPLVYQSSAYRVMA